MSKVPADLKYTQEHEWVRMDGAQAVVGITDYAQDQLGDIVFVELPKAGATVSALKACGTVESVKAASDLFSPLSGRVALVNPVLARTPEVINKDCYGAGWMFRIEPVQPAELANLLEAAAYEKLLSAGK